MRQPLRQVVAVLLLILISLGDPALAGNISRLYSWTTGEVFYGYKFVAELDQIINGHNNQESRISLLEGWFTSNILDVTHGGTGLNSISSGKLLYTSALNTLAPMSLSSEFQISAGTLQLVQSEIAIGSTTGTLEVSRGGTGATTSAQARSNLEAAKAGANDDITSLEALATPLSIPQGGTGASSSLNALQNLSGISTASNIGTSGVGFFHQKTDLDLEFKKINAGSGKITITDDTGNNEVDIDVNEASLSLDNITTGTIGATQIENDAITFSKIQNINTSKLLGRSTAGSGDVEEITVGSGLDLSAGTLTSTGTYDDEKAQDATGTILTDSGSIDFTYTDATPSITATVIQSGLDHGSISGLGDDDHTQYHNDARALTWLGTRSTSDLPEGTNKYYTDEQVDDRVSALIQNGTGITWSYNDGANTFTPTITSNSTTQKVEVAKAGALQGTRKQLNFIEGANVTLTIADDGPNDQVDITIAASGGGGGAPTTATYITQTSDGTLSAEQALADLATGVLKNTTTTGVLSIATEGIDYYKPSGTDVAIADGGTGASTATAAFDALAPTTTKGDIIVSNGTDNIRLAVGSDGKVLKANSSTASGLEWGDSEGSPNPKYRAVIELYDEFIGMGVTLSSTQAALVTQNGWDSRYFGASATSALSDGVVELISGTTSTGRAALINDEDGMRAGNGELTLEFSFRVPVLPTSGENFKLYLGFINSQSSESTDGCYFLMDQSVTGAYDAIRGRCIDGTSSNTSNTTISANTWYLGKIVINSGATSVSFYIDDVQVGSAVTTNIPSGTSDDFGIGFFGQKTAGTTSRTMVEIDHVEYWQSLTTSR